MIPMGVGGEGERERICNFCIVQRIPIQNMEITPKIELEKSAKDLNRHFTKKKRGGVGKQKTNKQVKRCSPSLAIMTTLHPPECIK